MSQLSKFEIDYLISALKVARKKHGRESLEVFKIIKRLKIMNPPYKGYNIENWERSALQTGSFFMLRKTIN